MTGIGLTHPTSITGIVITVSGSQMAAYLACQVFSLIWGQVSMRSDYTAGGQDVMHLLLGSTARSDAVQPQQLLHCAEEALGTPCYL